MILIVDNINYIVANNQGNKNSTREIKLEEFSAKVLNDLKGRDKQDMERTTDPLHIVPDAWVIDNTHLSIEAVVELIEKRVGEQTHEQG